jgi:hypothetical protein
MDPEKGRETLGSIGDLTKKLARISKPGKSGTGEVIEYD